NREQAADDEGPAQRGASPPVGRDRHRRGHAEHPGAHEEPAHRGVLAAVGDGEQQPSQRAHRERRGQPGEPEREAWEARPAVEVIPSIWIAVRHDRHHPARGRGMTRVYDVEDDTAVGAARRRTWRTYLGWAVTGLALVLVLFALIGPNQLGHL